MKYDDASWHYGADNFPDDLPPEAGATHIGMFAAWLALKGHVSEEFIEDFGEELELLKSREVTPGAWFISAFDEKLTDTDLDEQGNAFALAYYEGETPLYMEHFYVTFPDLGDYAVADTWENYDRLAPAISAAYEAFIGGELRKL